VDLGGHGDIEKTLLTDPQTSGGLLVTCAPDAVERVLEMFRSEGFSRAVVIGEIRAGTPSVEVL
jgi:selenide,water dikinase